MGERHDDTAILVELRYLRAGVDGINARLDGLNGRVRENEIDIAVLQDRAAQTKSEARASAAKWGAGLGAFVAALVAGLTQLFGGAK